MSRKSVFYIAFFAVLVVAFYFTMSWAIPGFSSVKLPVLSYVGNFQLTNQDGQAVDNKSMEGKVYVAEYFYTSCKSICPYMNGNMRTVYEKFKHDPGFLILSFTSDPVTDSAGRLKWYADSLKVDTKHWWFITGRKDSLYNLARNGYKLDDPQNNLKDINDQFIHTQLWALVDKSGRVRKYYDGLKKEEVLELTKDIGTLLKEPADQKLIGNNLTGN